MNTTFFQQTGLTPGDASLRLLGGLANPVVHAAYPMQAMTAFHAANHLPGLTGRWMDTGSTALGGAVRGGFHRLAHGHHFFDDGLKVLVNPELKFGEFLHHLGMDSLTRRGIPNPVVPKFVGEKLTTLGLKAGLSQSVINDLLTINLPKILGGGVALVCSGVDVYMAFSDAIPHTFMAAGMHFGIGAMELVMGCYPPNPLLLAAGVAEIGVSAVTAWRAWVDPLVPTLGMPQSVFLPMLGKAMALSALVGGAVGCVVAGSLAGGVKNGVAAAVGAGSSVTCATMAKAAGLAVAPVLGPLVGVTGFFLARKLMEAFEPEPVICHYNPVASHTSLNYFNPQIVPAFALPKRPIGRLNGDSLLLNEAADD